ncbi:OmpH family outer membrane protein [Oceanicaulis sp. AH-315-P02]|nr:OmpH family outer membrane protein [Oceanicaulis sp. AH-315-P02]
MKILNTFILAVAIIFGATLSAKADAKVAVISQQIALIQSKVGIDIATQVLNIDKQIDTEFESELAPLRSEAQQLGAEISALSPEALRTRTDLMRRDQVLRQTYAELGDWKKRQLEATTEQARKPLLDAYQAAVNQVIKENNIDILLDGSTVMFRNKASDITEQVIKNMDAAITSSIVVRVRVPRVAPQQQPGAQQPR